MNRYRILINGNVSYMVRGSLTPMVNPPEEIREKYNSTFMGSQVSHAIETYLAKAIRPENDSPQISIVLELI